MDPGAVAAAVEEIARIIRADGGDLVLVDADPGTARIRLRLELAGVECADCVLPPDQLHETIEAALSRRAVGEVEVVVDDPRRPTGR